MSARTLQRGGHGFLQRPWARRGRTCQRATNFVVDGMEDQVVTKGIAGSMMVLMIVGVIGACLLTGGLLPVMELRGHCVDTLLAPNVLFGLTAMLVRILAETLTTATTMSAAARSGPGECIARPWMRWPREGALREDVPRLVRMRETGAEGVCACARTPRRTVARAAKAPILGGWSPTTMRGAAGAAPLRQRAALRSSVTPLNDTEWPLRYAICLGVKRGEWRREGSMEEVPMVFGAEFGGRRRRLLQYSALVVDQDGGLRAWTVGAMHAGNEHTVLRCWERATASRRPQGCGRLAGRYRTVAMRMMSEASRDTTVAYVLGTVAMLHPAMTKVK